MKKIALSIAAFSIVASSLATASAKGESNDTGTIDFGGLTLLSTTPTPYGSQFGAGNGSHGGTSGGSYDPNSGVYTMTTTSFATASPTGTHEDFSGYAFYFQVQNTATFDQGITFTQRTVQHSEVSVDDPSREFAYAYTYAGVAMFNPDVHDYHTHYIDTSAGNMVGDWDVMFTNTIMVPAGTTKTFEIWASTISHAQAVPEPTSMFALGLGAIALIKKRRK